MLSVVLDVLACKTSFFPQSKKKKVGTSCFTLVHQWIDQFLSLFHVSHAKRPFFFLIKGFNSDRNLKL